MLLITAENENGQLVLRLPADAVDAEQATTLLADFAQLAPEARATFLEALAKQQKKRRPRQEPTPAAAGSSARDYTATLSADDRQYLRLLHEGLEQRDGHMIEFAYADLFALTEARRLKLPLSALQRNTLIQYYLDRHAQAGDTPDASIAALRHAAALARKKK